MMPPSDGGCFCCCFVSANYTKILVLKACLSINMFLFLTLISVQCHMTKFLTEQMLRYVWTEDEKDYLLHVIKEKNITTTVDSNQR